MDHDPTDLPLLPPGATWQQIPGLLDQQAAQIQARVDAAQGGHWHLAPERHMPPGTVRTNIDGYNRTIGHLERFRDADRDLILYAHADLTFLLEERARLKAELAESVGRKAALAEAAAAVLNVRGPLIHKDSVYAAYDAVRRIDDPDAPSIHDEPTDDDEDLDACTCVEWCDQDPTTACSLSGRPHMHPEIPGRPGVYGPCPVHPDRPGDR